MPELPEVEVVRRGLQSHLPGRLITAVRTDGKPLRQPVPAGLMQRRLPGRRVAAVRRRAKYLLLDLDDGAVLIIHLGMTGRLGIFPQGSPDSVHDHIFLELDNGLELRFNDVRRFGSVALLLAGETDRIEETFFGNTGPEPLGPHFSAEYCHRTASGRSQPVKNFLMNGSVVAGIGNIYANESLFAAGIRPSRPVGSVSLKKWHRLVDEIRAVLEHAIACGGSTISDFFGADGESGYFQVNFAVYGRKNQACPRCTTPIAHIKLGGRASFYCPKCQR